MSKILEQVLKFGLVGVLATVIDFGLLTVLTELVHIHYLTSAAVSFIVSTIFNYLISMKYVFNSKFTADKKHIELLLFIILSVVGLALNQIFMWIFVEKMKVFYIIGKVFATVLVMGWNFLSRKKWLE